MLDPVTKKTSRFDPIRLFFTSKRRINRQQYVLGWLILVALYIPLGGFFQLISGIVLFENIWVISQIGFMALFIIPHFFIMIKRLHDFNTSGLFTLFIFIQNKITCQSMKSGDSFSTELFLEFKEPF